MYSVGEHKELANIMPAAIAMPASNMAYPPPSFTVFI
jgi:hypothetical protein